MSNCNADTTIDKLWNDAFWHLEALYGGGGNKSMLDLRETLDKLLSLSEDNEYKSKLCKALMYSEPLLRSGYGTLSGRRSVNYNMTRERLFSAKVVLHRISNGNSFDLDNNNNDM